MGKKYKQTFFQSLFTLFESMFESTKCSFQKQMQGSSAKVALKSNELLISLHQFCKIRYFPLIMTKEHVLLPLFRHSDVTAHLITEQITVMDDPNNAIFFTWAYL